MDFSKVKSIVIPEGGVKEIRRNGVLLWKKSGFKNWLKYSIELNSTNIYNNGLGYKIDTRLNSSAEEVTLAGYGTCGYIPVKAGDVIRVKGIRWDSIVQTGGYFWTFDSSFTKQKSKRPTSGSSDIIVSAEENGIISFKIASYRTETAYFRLSAWGLGPATIITVNEQIPENSANYTNQISTSINADGSIYNGVGYKNGFRVRSGGEEGEASNASCTGFIRAVGGNVVRLSGYNVKYANNENAINVYNASYTNLGQVSANHFYGIFADGSQRWEDVILEKEGVYYWVVPEGFDIAYIRVSGYTSGDGSTMIVTINEEIG